MRGRFGCMDGSLLVTNSAPHVGHTPMSASTYGTGGSTSAMVTGTAVWSMTTKIHSSSASFFRAWSLSARGEPLDEFPECQDCVIAQLHDVGALAHRRVDALPLTQQHYLYSSSLMLLIMTVFLFYLFF